MTPAAPLLIAPSLLAADFAKLGEEIAAVERGGADLLHIDVMDGHFVPNLSMGPPIVQAIRRVATVPLDVHLMIANPDQHIAAFVEAGAARVTVHVEVLPHLHRTLQYIRSLNARPGVALNPSTPVSAIAEVIEELDQVIIMSVNPGFGGQAFIPRSEGKIRALRELLDRAGSRALVSVDGGVDRTNAARLVAAGAGILVAGSSVFGGSSAEEAARALRAAALEAAGSAGPVRGR